MNRTTWLLGLLLPVSALAQPEPVPPPKPPVHGLRITLDGQGLYDSNVLFNNLIVGLYRGGDLPKDVRQRSLDALGNFNRAGYDLGATLTVAWGDSLFGHAGWMPRASLSHHAMMGLRFTRDAFAMAFFGNSQFEDATAHIGPGAFAQQVYQSLAFGVEDRRSGSFLELAVVNGRWMNAGHIVLADLYTAPYGRYLDLDLDGQYQRTDTAARRALSNGIGAAVNFTWRNHFNLFGTQASLSAGITDLGFIAWNGNSLQVKKDSSIRYEGIEVHDILGLDNLLVGRKKIQDSLGLGYSKGAFLSPLPFLLHARLGFGQFKKATRSLGRSAYECDIDQRYLPGYVPHAEFTRNFVVTGRLMARAGAGYGGFGGLRGALGAEAVLGQHLSVAIDAPNVVGLCFGDARGKALALRLEATW